MRAGDQNSGPHAYPVNEELLPKNTSLGDYILPSTHMFKKERENLKLTCPSSEKTTGKAEARCLQHPLSPSASCGTQSIFAAEERTEFLWDIPAWWGESE